MNIFIKFFKKLSALIVSPFEAWSTIFNNQRKIREINFVVEQQTQLISHLASVQNEMVNVVISREVELSKSSSTVQLQDDPDEFIN